MYLFENPVLQHELLINLRRGRAFVLLAVYVGLLSLVVLLVWQSLGDQIDLTDPTASKRLINMFFLGQYLLASLMAPSFAAGAITGEKERKTYELLLASPLKPGAMLVGKLLGSMTHLALLIVASLPIVMLCLPLGGLSLYEVLATYVGIIVSVITFGMISLTCSSFFGRTSASLVVSYLTILPMALVGLLFWQVFSGPAAQIRLFILLTIVPALGVAVWVMLYIIVSRRLLRPPDVGSEGKEVVDEEQEQREAVGLVIHRDQFPDKLFAPAKRNQLLPDGTNPVFDKEMRSEVFSQGTLMMRIVIQVSMFLAIPLMGVCLYLMPQLAPWYIAYVLLFNMLVGPVFSAGTVTSERERATLELLLVTILTPMQILWGKLFSGLRVSVVLTSLILWPVLLACLMVPRYWTNMLGVLVYLLIIAATCLTTSMIGLFASVVFRKTSTSLMMTYLAIIVLFFGPVAGRFFADTFYSDTRISAPSVSAAATTAENAQPRRSTTYTVAEITEMASFTSPFSAVRSVPLDMDDIGGTPPGANPASDWPTWLCFLVFSVLFNGGLYMTMSMLFKRRWMVAQ